MHYHTFIINAIFHLVANKLVVTLFKRLQLFIGFFINVPAATHIASSNNNLLLHTATLVRLLLLLITVLIVH